MKNKTAIIAAALALLLAIAAFPLPAFKISALPSEPVRTVPEGYNAHDYNKCAAFLELTDEYGTKNGIKLSSDYNVNDPSTWGTSYGPDEEWFYDTVPCFGWYDNGTELVLRRVCVEDRALCGCLDLAGCTSLYIIHCPINQLTGLNASGCAALEYISCYGNDFSELNISGCAALTNLDCASTGITELDLSDCSQLLSVTCQLNQLTELDFSGCSSLHYLHCEHNRLTRLCLSGCSQLYMVFCFENELTELDLASASELERLFCYSNRLTALDVSVSPVMTYLDCTGNELRQLKLSENDALPLNEVRAEGNGNFDCEAIFTTNDVVMHAYAGSGDQFLGWYDENGDCVSTGALLTGIYNGESKLTARFSGSSVAPGCGDLDGDGETTIADALIALRIAMGLIEGTPEQITAGDMDGDDVITVTDAILILRMTMGL